MLLELYFLLLPPILPDLCCRSLFPIRMPWTLQHKWAKHKITREEKTEGGATCEHLPAPSGVFSGTAHVLKKSVFGKWRWNKLLHFDGFTKLLNLSVNNYCCKMYKVPHCKTCDQQFYVRGKLSGRLYHFQWGVLNSKLEHVNSGLTKYSWGSTPGLCVSCVCSVQIHWI